MEATTLIEIEYNGKTIESIRDVSIPCIGDSLHLSSTTASVNPAIFIVKKRHWVIDTNQSHRLRELRCILEVK